MSLKRNYLGIKMEYEVGYLSVFQRNISVLPLEGRTSLSLCVFLFQTGKACLFLLSNCHCLLLVFHLAGEGVR